MTASPRVAEGGAPRPEGRRHDLGHRLLPQHLPRRHQAAGHRLLDAERRHLAQDQPDAELPRPALHQRARDDDLVRQVEGQPPRLQLRGDEAPQRRAADAQRLAAADLLRRGAAEGRARARRATRPRSRKPCSTASLLRRPSQGMWCWTRSSGRGTTGAVAKRLGRRWIGIERDPAYIDLARKRIAAVQAVAERELLITPSQARGAADSVRLAGGARAAASRARCCTASTAAGPPRCGPTAR